MGLAFLFIHGHISLIFPVDFKLIRELSDCLNIPDNWMQYFYVGAVSITLKLFNIAFFQFWCSALLWISDKSFQTLNDRYRNPESGIQSTVWKNATIYWMRKLTPQRTKPPQLDKLTIYFEIKNLNPKILKSLAKEW